MDEKKKYISPDAEIIDFSSDDIITLSDNGLAGWDDGNQESW